MLFDLKELLEKTGVSNGVLKSLVDKGVMELYKKEISRLDTIEIETESLKVLNDNQNESLTKIKDEFKDKDVVLFHGITGSGKTEVYMHLIEEIVEKGEQVLFMVPEIALTTQLTERLKKVFGTKLAIYHSTSQYCENDLSVLALIAVLIVYINVKGEFHRFFKIAA